MCLFQQVFLASPRFALLTSLYVGWGIIESHARVVELVDTHG